MITYHFNFYGQAIYTCQKDTNFGNPGQPNWIKYKTITIKLTNWVSLNLRSFIRDNILDKTYNDKKMISFIQNLNFEFKKNVLIKFGYIEGDHNKNIEAMQIEEVIFNK